MSKKWVYDIVQNTKQKRIQDTKQIRVQDTKQKRVQGTKQKRVQDTKHTQKVQYTKQTNKTTTKN